MDKFKKFDGIKFRQAMKLSRPTEEFYYCEDYELHKEGRIKQASGDCQRMWRFLWQKLKWQERGAK